MLRGNWSSTMTSASAPSSLASQDASSPATARRHRPRYRPRTPASNSSSRVYQRSGPASRQKARIAAGATSVPVMPSGPHTGSGRGLLLVAQFAAQDLADIGLGQVGSELDLLGDL